MARLVREAAGQGAIYVQTPEMTGALQRDRAGAAGRSCGTRATTSSSRTRRELAARTRHPPACRLDGDRARRRQDRQSRLPVRPGRRARDAATTRSTCSTSISTMARAGARVRSIARARRPAWPILPFAELGFAICYDVRFPAAVPGRGGGRRRDHDAFRPPSPARPARRIGKSCCGPAPSRTACSSSPPRRPACTRTGARPSAIR